MRLVCYFWITTNGNWTFHILHILPALLPPKCHPTWSSSLAFHRAMPKSAKSDAKVTWPGSTTWNGQGFCSDVKRPHAVWADLEVDQCLYNLYTHFPCSCVFAMCVWIMSEEAAYIMQMQMCMYTIAKPILWAELEVASTPINWYHYVTCWGHFWQRGRVSIEECTECTNLPHQTEKGTKRYAVGKQGLVTRTTKNHRKLFMMLWNWNHHLHVHQQQQQQQQPPLPQPRAQPQHAHTHRIRGTIIASQVSHSNTCAVHQAFNHELKISHKIETYKPKQLLKCEGRAQKNNPNLVGNTFWNGQVTDNSLWHLSAKLPGTET